MTRDEWVAKHAAWADEAEALGATAPIATVLRAVLASLDEVDGVAVKSPDVMLTLADTATRLNVPVRWLTENKRSLPFIRSLTRGTVRVSEKALTRWLATR